MRSYSIEAEAARQAAMGDAREAAWEVDREASREAGTRAAAH